MSGGAHGYTLTPIPYSAPPTAWATMRRLWRAAPWGRGDRHLTHFPQYAATFCVISVNGNDSVMPRHMGRGDRHLTHFPQYAATFCVISTNDYDDVMPRQSRRLSGTGIYHVMLWYKPSGHFRG